MKYVILKKARPYTRVRRGKMERVKGYASRLGKFPGVLEEATVHQIAKDYAVSKDEARKIYMNVFAPEEEEKQARKEMSRAKTEAEVKEVIKKWGTVLYKPEKREKFSLLEREKIKEEGYEPPEFKPRDPLRERLEWERRMSGKFGGKDLMVVALRTPQVGDKVMWTDRHSFVANPKDRPLTVVGFQGNLIIARDAGGMDLMVHPSDVKIEAPSRSVVEVQKPKDMDSKLQTLKSMIEQHQAEVYKKQYPSLEPPKVKIKHGEKYIKVDVGSSGKYMVEKATGDIYGIKGYGVIHRGHYYGNLNTIGDYFWGEYTAFKKKPKRTMADMPGKIPGYSLG